MQGIEGIERGGIGGAIAVYARLVGLAHHVMGAGVVQVGIGHGNGHIGHAIDDLVRRGARLGALAFAHKFHTGGQSVAQAKGEEFSIQVGLVGGDLVFLVSQLARTGHGPVGRVARVVSRQGVDASEDTIGGGFADARSVAQRGHVIEVVLEFGGKHVGFDIFVVTAAAVEVVAVHLGAGIQTGIGIVETVHADGRDAAIGDVVLPYMLGVQVQTGIGLQAEGQRRGHAVAAVFHGVTAVDVTVAAHQVQAQGRVVTHALVDVGGQVALVRSAIAEGATDGVFQGRQLGHQVDIARRGAAADIGAGRALDHFHLLKVEHVAADRAEVANTVDKGRVLGGEAAHHKGVAGRGIAVLAQLHGDAGGVAQGFHQAVGALLAQDFLLDHLHGFGRIQQVLGHLGVGTALGLVRHFALGGGGHAGAGQVQLRLAGVVLGGHGHGRNGGGDQGREVAGLVVFAAANGHIFSPVRANEHLCRTSGFCCRVCDGRALKVQFGADDNYYYLLTQ